MKKGYLPIVKTGFLFYALLSMLLFGVFVWYIYGTSVSDSMTPASWFYYITAAVSQAALFSLVPFLLSSPALIAGKAGRKLIPTLIIIFSIITITYFIANGTVYSLYRFHINGFILEMLTGDSAGDIFQFDIQLYAKVCATIFFIVAIIIAMWFVCKWLYRHKNYVAATPIISVIVFCSIYSNLYHAYADAMRIPEVVRSSAALPYYAPLTANRFMQKLGVVSKETLSTNIGGGNGSGLKYPQNEIVAQPLDTKKNILFILIDSWNKRTWSEECFPNIWDFATECSCYENHISSSNGTYGSVFGLFFGLPSYFRKDVDVSGLQPVLINTLLEQNYDVKAFASATLVYPPFARLIFSNVPDLRVESKGETVYERDCEITDEFIQYIDTTGNEPFFAFMFYDLAHGYEMPDDKKNHFKPSWKYADYLALNNETDPTPFWNLYRNSLFQVDSLVGCVLNKLEEKEMLKNTIVVLTGDHGQEFNENKKNYWGHGSNYSPVQIRVPFFVFDAEQAAKTYRHRTTHYDFSTTLLKRYLGVKNPVTDLGCGHMLDDKCSRDYHIVGGGKQDYHAGYKKNYAFILEDDMTILEKKYSGGIEVYDSLMNPIDDYKIDATRLNKAILELNRFYTE